MQVENELFLSASSPLPSLFNNLPAQCVPFAVRAAWEWHQKAKGALLRSQARSHRDICGGKGSPYQQTARVQTHKQTQINRLTPPCKPEVRARRQMCLQPSAELLRCAEMHVRAWVFPFPAARAGACTKVERKCLKQARFYRCTIWHSPWLEPL